MDSACFRLLSSGENQGFSLEDVRESVLANTGSLLTFRISDREEATFLARHFGSPIIGASDIQQLPRWQAYLQVTHDGERRAPAWLSLPAASRLESLLREQRLIAAARTRYAKPRALVEAEIERRERASFDGEDEEPEVRSLPRPAVEVLADATGPSRSRSSTDAWQAHG